MEERSFVITQRPPKALLEFKAGRAAQNTQCPYPGTAPTSPSADNG